MQRGQHGSWGSPHPSLSVHVLLPPLFSLHSGLCFIGSSIKQELALGLEFQSEGSSVVYSGLSFLYIFFYFTEFSAVIFHNRQDSAHVYFLFLQSHLEGNLNEAMHSAGPMSVAQKLGK